MTAVALACRNYQYSAAVNWLEFYGISIAALTIALIVPCRRFPPRYRPIEVSLIGYMSLVNLIGLEGVNVQLLGVYQCRFHTHVFAAASLGLVK
ncbi:MAG: hypothetical protein EDM05_000505 [Leptolyngbya sp. IPPAS B-1204]